MDIIVAERLLGLRQNLKATQQKLSKLLGISQTAVIGISQTTVNRYEHGETAINSNALRRNADFFLKEKLFTLAEEEN